MQVYAAAATIESGRGFVFTGNVGSGPTAGGFEVDFPPVTGGLVHGFAGPTNITSGALSDDHVELARPAIVQVSGPVNAQDVLSIRSDGITEKRVTIAAACAQALQASAGGSVQAALFLGPDRQALRKVGLVADPTETSGSFQTIPQMSATLTLRNGGGIALIFGASLEIQTGDDVEIAVFLVDSMAVATEVAGLRRRINGPARHTTVAIATQIPPSDIPGPTPHEVRVSWRALAGTARAVDLHRSLWVGQY